MFKDELTANIGDKDARTYDYKTIKETDRSLSFWVLTIDSKPFFFRNIIDVKLIVILNFKVREKGKNKVNRFFFF